MANVGEAASVLYPPALAEVVGCVVVSDRPRVRGRILITFRDERGTLVTILLMPAAAGGLLKALQSGSIAQITDIGPNRLAADPVEIQANARVEAPPV
jgi:hypothetical protein